MALSHQRWIFEPGFPGGSLSLQRRWRCSNERRIVARFDGGTIALLGGQVQNDGTITAKLGTVALAAGNRVTLDFAGDGLTKVTVDEGALAAEIQNRGAVIADGGQAILTARAAHNLTTSVVNHSGIVRAQSLVERGGQIVLDAGEDGTMTVAGNVDASGSVGASGGEIKVLGGAVELAVAKIDASGDRGGGKILIGGDYQGKNPEVPNSRSTTVGTDVTIAADALGDGNGGRVIVWSSGPTAVHGAITANGGSRGGDGGFVETSGSKLELRGARVSAGSPHGVPGSWLLDPQDIIIGATEASTIATSLAQNSVSIVTTDVPVPPPPVVLLPGLDGPGNITVNSPITKASGLQATTLQLLADANITINANASISSTAGPLNVEMVSRKGATGLDTRGFVSVSSDISTNGGRVVITGGSDGLNTIRNQNIADIQGFAVGSDGGGVSVLSATINAGGGDVLIRGAEPFTVGVDVFRSTITGRNVQLTGIGGLVGDDGVRIVGSALTAAQELRIEVAGGTSFTAQAGAGFGSKASTMARADRPRHPDYKGAQSG